MNAGRSFSGTPASAERCAEATIPIEAGAQRAGADGATNARAPRAPWPAWPTLLVALAVYAGFAGLTWWHNALPWPLVLVFGGVLVCWQGSLQHETVHGHPTRWSWLNTALGAPGVSLWLPYLAYRADHLRHHATPHLTDPVEDPESFLFRPQDWAAMPAWLRALWRWHATLSGRLLAGPPLLILRFWFGEARRIGAGDRARAAAWAWHLAGLVPIGWWLLWVCEIAWWQYWLLYVWPGLSLTLMRSYLEHRPAGDTEQRSAIVEGPRPFSLLYLNNNLHVLHHLMPALPWFELARRYRDAGAAWRARNGGYVYRGYGEVARRHLFRAAVAPVMPAAPPKI